MRDDELPAFVDRIMPLISRKKFATGTVNTRTISTATSTGGASTSALAALQAAFNAHQGLDFVDAHTTEVATVNQQRTYYSNRFGIHGGAGVNESQNLLAMFNYVGANGGGRCVIAATNYADNVIRLDSLASVYYSHLDIEVRSPISLGSTGGIRTMGSMDEYIAGSATFAAGIATGHDAVEGDTVIFLSASAGKMQASDITAGMSLTFRGENDASGAALTKQKVIVASVNTGANTITLATALENDFAASYPSSAYHPVGGGTDATTIYVNRTWPLTANATRYAMTVTVANTTNMAVGDMVCLSDARVEVDLNPAALRSGGAGPYKNECHLEYHTIADITGLVVTLRRPVSKNYLQGAPYYGNISKVLPVENVHIHFKKATYYQDQVSRNSHAFSLNFSKDCTINGGLVDGSIGLAAGNGARGQMYRISDSLNCWGLNLIGRNPAHWDSAEGYVASLYKSSGSGYDNCDFSGGRHNCLIQASTVFKINNCRIYDAYISGGDTHGVEEYDGIFSNCEFSQMNHHAPGVTDGACLRLFNTSHTVGSHYITVKNCTFHGNPETSIAAIDFGPASDHIVIEGCDFHGCYNGVQSSKNPSQCTPTQTAAYVTIRDCEFFDITNFPIFLEGVPDTASGTRSSAKLDNIQIENCTEHNCSQHLKITGGDAVTNVTIDNYIVRNPIATTNINGLIASNVAGLIVRFCNFSGCNKGISLTNCTLTEIIGNTFKRLVNTTIYTDGGGNTGIYFSMNQTDTGVGIGNLAPTVALHITGSLRVTGALLDSANSPGTSGQALTSTVTGSLWATITGASQWVTTGSDIYYNTGKVGIGNATPAAALDIVKDPTNITGYYGQLFIAPASNNQDAAITLRTTESTDRSWALIAGSGAPNMNFRIYDVTAAADRLNIDTSGNVGIGFTAPTASLEIARGSGADGALKIHGTTYASFFNYSTAEDTYIRGGKASAIVHINDGNIGDIALVEGGGKVGIGTASPTQALSVIGVSENRYASATRYAIGMQPLSALGVVYAYDYTGSAYTDLVLDAATIALRPGGVGTYQATLNATGDLGVLGNLSVALNISTLTKVTAPTFTTVTSPQSKFHLHDPANGSAGVLHLARVSYSTLTDLLPNGTIPNSHSPSTLPGCQITGIAYHSSSDTPVNVNGVCRSGQVIDCVVGANTMRFTVSSAGKLSCNGNFAGTGNWDFSILVIFI